MMFISVYILCRSKAMFVIRCGFVNYLLSAWIAQ